MHNSKLKPFKFLIVVLPFTFYFLSFFGCATTTVTPTRESFATYSINETTYYSLIELCQSRGVSWQYDTFTKSATLNGNGHRINLRAGDNLILVDNSVVILNSPVELYQGKIVVPDKFKELYFDSLFRKDIVSQVPGVIKRPTQIKKVVIDPGHGGNDPGAIGKNGLREKDVNLDIAKRLAGELRAQGVEVIMTRTSDNFIALPVRASIANNSGADLFVSIHSNANRVRSLNGFETYYVSTTVSDSQRAQDSAKSAILNVDSQCFASNSADLKAIVWDMIYTNSRAESIELGRCISRSMDNNMDAKILGNKEARFLVLREVRMPAVLIEVGFVSNAEEEKLLRDGSYRQRLAETISDGVFDYAQSCNIMEAKR